MPPEEKLKRLRERLELTLPVRVHCRESLDQEWVELTRLMDVSPFGARLSLSRATEPGRLIHLTMPLPSQLRCFDGSEQQYRIWAVVTNVRPVPPDAESPRFEVGVAFVGKEVPEAHHLDPSQRYKAVRAEANGELWDIQEIRPQEHNESDSRPETRHSIPFEIRVTTFDSNGKPSESEVTVTENISRHGAAIFTSLQIEPGSYIRLTAQEHKLSVFAVVRARRKGTDGITRLHVEFIGQEWPLDVQ